MERDYVGEKSYTDSPRTQTEFAGLTEEIHATISRLEDRLSLVILHEPESDTNAKDSIQTELTSTLTSILRRLRKLDNRIKL